MKEMSVYAPTTLEQSREVARVLAASGLVPDALRGKPEAVWVILALGAELGLGPMASLNGIHVINGRPSPAPQTMLAMCLKSPVCERFTPAETTGDSATWVAKRVGSPEVTMSFTMAQARKANLGSSGGWAKYPEAMLRWRAMAALARVVFPDIVMGLYTTDEVDDFEHAPRRDEPSAPPAAPRRTEPTRAERAQATVARRVEALRTGGPSARPAVADVPAESVEDAVLLAPDVAPDYWHREVRAALAAAGITERQFDAYAGSVGRPALAGMPPDRAEAVASWLSTGGTGKVRAHAAMRPSAPSVPSVPRADELEAALAPEGVDWAMVEAWAAHVGADHRTDVGARAVWQSIMHPTDGGRAFGSFFQANQREEDE
jgi:hypothetical protein